MFSRWSGGRPTAFSWGPWWARSQRIRTAAELPFEIPLFQTAEARVYQRIAARALRLKQLGLTSAVIARYLGVSDKTATRAIAWIQRQAAD